MFVGTDCVKRSSSSSSSRLQSSLQSAGHTDSSSRSDTLICFSNRDRSVVIYFVIHSIVLQDCSLHFGISKSFLYHQYT